MEWSTGWGAGELVTSLCVLGAPSTGNCGMIDGADSVGAKGCLSLETRRKLRVQAPSEVDSL